MILKKWAWFIAMTLLSGHALAHAGVAWPKNYKGRVIYSRGNVPEGKCAIALSVSVTPEHALNEVATKIDHCVTVSRGHFDLSFSMNADGWKWIDGKGYFQDKLSGRITDEEIVLSPWGRGQRIRVLRRSAGQIVFSLGFEHNNRFLKFEGALDNVSSTAEGGLQ